MTENSSAIFGILGGLVPDTATFVTRETGISFASRKVQHAIDASGQRCILVPLDGADIVPEIENYSSISIESLITDPAIPSERTLVIRCVEPALFEQFSLIVDEMLETLRQHPERRALACLGVLERWRQLLQLVPSTLLSFPAQAGLLAELHLLDAIVLAHGPRALRTWLGAEGSRHDFVAAGSVEVKATLSRQKLAVVVHGATQLEPPISGKLLLFVEQLEQVPTGESISELVSKLLDAGLDRTEFLAKLRSSGFELRDSAAYSNCRFAVLRRELFEVDASFPRLSPNTIEVPKWMDVISGLEYTLDLGAIESLSSGPDALHAAAFHLGAS